MSHFELQWLGGTSERLFHTHRGDVDELPWGSFDRSRFHPKELDYARSCWTIGAHQEWCAAAGFSALLTALLQARAPVDVVGMAGRFVADEMVHTELNARMAAIVGGGVKLEVDPTRLCPEVEGAPLYRAVELAVRISCVGESFSLPVLSETRKLARDPLVKAVLSRIVADEAPHALLGWVVLDWALPLLDASQRQRLGHAAVESVNELRGTFRPAQLVSEGASTAGGCLPPAHYAVFAERTIQRKILAPLRDRGVPIAA